MTHRGFLLAGLILLAGSAGLMADEKAAKEFVEAKKATAGQLKPLADEALGKVVPGRSYFTLLFRQYPIGIEPPEGFSPSNVLVVTKAGNVNLIPNNKELQAFAKASFSVKDEAQAKAAARAWLLLSSELTQDGFYKFQVLDESLKTSKEADKMTATGRLVVMQGGNGELTVQLTFDALGKLVTIKETAKIVAGPRPICQASKLLDADPLVRKICEADLLIMGEAARDYLMEQRARATPALQAEIDRVWQRILKGER